MIDRFFGHFVGKLINDYCTEGKKQNCGRAEEVEYNCNKIYNSRVSIQSVSCRQSAYTACILYFSSQYSVQYQTPVNNFISNNKQITKVTSQYIVEWVQTTVYRFIFYNLFLQNIQYRLSHWHQYTLHDRRVSTPHVIFFINNNWRQNGHCVCYRTKTFCRTSFPLSHDQLNR